MYYYLKIYNCFGYVKRGCLATPLLILTYNVSDGAEYTLAPNS